MVLGVMSDLESIPLLAKRNITKANTPSMLVVNPQVQSLLEVRLNIRRKSKRISILLSICQDKSSCWQISCQFNACYRSFFPSPPAVAPLIKLLLILFHPGPSTIPLYVSSRRNELILSISMENNTESDTNNKIWDSTMQLRPGRKIVLLTLAKVGLINYKLLSNDGIYDRLVLETQEIIK